MSETVLRVLLIEDNPGDAELVKEALANADADGATFQVFCAGALLSGLDRLARGDIDLVLLDLSLPDSHGLEGLTIIHTHAPSVPVVVLTGWDSESLALRAVQSGAQDYVVKGKLEGPALARTLQHAVVRQELRAGASGGESQRKQATVVGFLGAKGGVGATTIACHIGMELKRQTTEGGVLMMDLDLAGGPIGFLMNATAPYGIMDASADILHLDEDRWRKLVAAGAGGVDIMRSGGPAFREEGQPKEERVRFVLRFVRSFYRWIVVDLGRMSPFSAHLALGVSRLYLVSTCDILGLHEAKSVITALTEGGFDRERLALILNQAQAMPGISQQDVEKSLGVPAEAMLPECNKDFVNSFMDGKRLGESKKYQKQVAQLAATISGVKNEPPKAKTRFTFLSGALRRATSGN